MTTTSNQATGRHVEEKWMGTCPLGQVSGDVIRKVKTLTKCTTYPSLLNTKDSLAKRVLFS